jgi:hypothetical protein
LQLLVRRILRTGKEPRNGPVSDDFERNSYGFFELFIVVAVGWKWIVIIADDIIIISRYSVSHQALDTKSSAHADIP